jgi:signal transduction histidine kinase
VAQKHGSALNVPRQAADGAAADGADALRAEIRRLEHELRRPHRLESLGQLIGGVAHEFNNLLAVIGNYASLVREEVSVAEATESATRWAPVRRDVEQIEDAADRATSLAEHLVAFARRDETQPVLVDLGRMLHDVVRLLGRVLGEHVRLVTRPGTGLLAVEADPGQLEQAIISIVVNACDAMPSGGQVTIEAASIDTANLGVSEPCPEEVADLFPGRYVRLRISDTGTGMDAVTAGRAFEPFFTTKGGDQAAGLGLSAVRMFAGRTGGMAWLRSAPGAGTTVTMLLPAARGAASVLTRPAVERPAVATERASTVLVVDDEAAIRDVAHRILTRAGYRVMTAAGQAQALAILSDPGVPVDLLLTDVIMPGMTGPALAAQAGAVRPGIRVLFMSGYDQRTAMPGVQVISKPFSRAVLLARVNQLLIADLGAAAGLAGGTTSRPPGRRDGRRAGLLARRRVLQGGKRPGEGVGPGAERGEEGGVAGLDGGDRLVGEVTAAGGDGQRPGSSVRWMRHPLQQAPFVQCAQHL